MKEFWTGFEKRSFMLRPEYQKKYQPYAKKALKSIWGAGVEVINTLKRFKVPVEIKVPKEDINQIIGRVKKDLTTFHHEAHLPKDTKEWLGKAFTHAADRTEEIKKIKPGDIIWPALAASAGIGAGALLGKRVAQKVLKQVGAGQVESQQFQQGYPPTSPDGYQQQ